jgi:hypothetical protein
MAEPDHTVLARLSGRPDTLSARFSSVPRDTADNDEIAQLEIRSAIAGIEQIKLVITYLLADSDAFREAIASGAQVEPCSWPLPASTYASVLAATHYLEECAGVLRHELHG